jgi:hypothetical protein
VSAPFFSVEIVVVDDGSSDGTVATLAAEFTDPRLRVVALDANHGMSEARRVGSETAVGDWVVILDSDWELEPYALSRMRATIEQTPDEVRVLWFRMRWDDGTILPSTLPAGIVGYEDKLAWWNTTAVSDAVRCVRREIFEATPYHPHRRGAMDTLYELELARNELAVYSEEVLSLQHSDAANSWLRAADPAALIPRLKQEAPDMLWMSETTLMRHGAALARFAPSVRLVLWRTAAVQAFILGQRRRGLSHAVAALRAAPRDVSLWATIVAGIAGPWVMLQAIVLDRRVARLRLERHLSSAGTHKSARTR